MAGIYDKKIDKSVDWGGDSHTGNLPVSGRRVQEFIKDELEHRAGVFFYDSANSRYLVFADEANRDAYLADPTKVELLLATFDAPSNYEASISLITPNFNAILLGATGNNIEFKFDTVNKSGASVGEDVVCTYTFVRGGSRKVVTERYRYGTTVKFNVDSYLAEGTNNITIGIVGVDTLAATTVGVTYQVVNLSVSTSYDISRVYNLTTVPDAKADIPYSVSGTGTKTMEWYVDGKLLAYESTDEIVEATATRTKYIDVSGLSQGSHSVQARAYVTINGEQFYSNTLYLDIMVYTGADRKPMIAIATEIPSAYGIVVGDLKLYGIEQYIPYTFQFAVYNPTGAASTTASISVGGVLQGSVETSNGNAYSYTIRMNTSGAKDLLIKAGETSYNATLVIDKSSLDIAENNDNLLINLYAVGRTNDDTNRDEWADNGYTATLSGFKWNNTSGWVGDRLVISDGANIEVNLAPFASAATTTGLTFEMEFATSDVDDEDAVVCDLRNSAGKGMLVTASTAQLVSTGDAKVSTKYKSGENLRIAFVVNPATGTANKGLVFVYVDGILSGAANFAENDNFLSDALLKVGGSTKVVVKLKHIRIYRAALGSDGILNNYILYRDNVSDMLATYNRNDILDGRAFDLDALASQCPVLKVTGDIPTLENTTSKDETIYVDVEYVNMQDPTLSFTGAYLQMRPQGTSSMGYPKKNFRLYTQKNENSRIYDYQGKEITSRLYAFKQGAQPVNCWCFKADYAESSGTHNTAIARLWNKVMYDALIDGEYKLRTEAQKAAARNGYPYDVRTTVDGFPCHIVYRLDENSDWIYIGKYNFNNDKSTESVFGFTGIKGFDNTRMQCWEVLNNGNHLALFEDVENFDTEWSDAYESRYPDTKTPDTSDLKAFCEWVVSTKGDVEKFKAEKWNHMDVYKAAAYYIYVMRFGAVDQTVKNSMLTSEDGVHFYWINYDNDTINGLRNDGLLAFDYTIDRQSLDPNYNISPDPEHEVQVYAYAGHGSTLWNHMEADSEFMEIVAKVDQALYVAGLSYANVIRMFDEEQSAKWCERVYNQDAQYKYISPYTDKGTNNLFMLQGARRAHRRWWLSHRFDLIDSQFVSGKYKANIIDFKVMNGTPIGQQFSIVSGNLLYYGYGVNDIPTETGVKLDKGESYTFTTVQVLNIGDPVRIYSAQNIRELDVSPLMERLTQLGVSGVYDEENGSKLKRLIIGDGTSVSTGLTELSGLSQARELEELDIRGCLGLSSVGIGELTSLRIFKAQGSGLTSFIPASGALLSEVGLPETLTAMTLRSLALLDGITVEGSARNLATIQISDCPNLTDSYTFFGDWYANKLTEDRMCTLELDNVKWQGITPQQLLAIGQLKVNGGILKLKGMASITETTAEIVDELISIFGENCFDKNSEFYISAPNAIYVSGASELIEGDSAQYTAAVFSEYQGTVEWSIASGSGASIDSNGLLTTTIKGSARNIVIQARHIPTQGVIVTSTKNIFIARRIRPNGGTIDGADVVGGDTTFTLTPKPIIGINTPYSVSWSVSGEAVDNGIVGIKSQEKLSCVVGMLKSGEGAFTLTATITTETGAKINVTKELTTGSLLTIVMNSYQENDEVIEALEVTVTYNGVTVTCPNGGSIGVPVGIEITVSFPQVSGYYAPDSVTYVSSYNEYIIKVEYNWKPIGVFIEDIDGELYTSEQWDGSKSPNGIAVCTDNCSFVIVETISLVSWHSYNICPEERLVSGITTTTEKDVALGDFNGEYNTKIIYESSLDYTDMFAVKYAYDYIAPNGKNCYLGALGEVRAIYINRTSISEIEDILGIDIYEGVSMIASSTQYDYVRMWVMDVPIYTTMFKDSGSAYGYYILTTLKKYK